MFHFGNEPICPMRQILAHTDRQPHHSPFRCYLIKLPGMLKAIYTSGVCMHSQKTAETFFLSPPPNHLIFFIAYILNTPQIYFLPQKIISGR